MSFNIPGNRNIKLCSCSSEEREAIQKELSRYNDLQLNYTESPDFSEISDIYIIPSRILSDLSRETILDSTFPIIAFGPLDQIRVAFGFGIRDYIQYPFSGEELAARIYRNSLRSFYFRSDEFFSFSNSRLIYRDHSVLLTKTEFLYLSLLVNAAGDVIPREILSSIISRKNKADSRSLDMSISKLRTKLKTLLDIEQDLITAERGFGYRLLELR